MTPANTLQLTQWFEDNNRGIGIVCGDVSGGLEIIDFDNASMFDPWCNNIRRYDCALFDRIVIVKTPDGYHIYLRSPGSIQGNLKLAEH